MARVLIVDDDDLMCDVLQRKVIQLGHEAVSAYTLRDGLRRASMDDPDVVYLDVHMPDGSGLEAIPRFRSVRSHPEIIIITGVSDADGADLAMQGGAWDYVEKGCSLKAMTLPLLRVIDYLREKKTGSASSQLRLDGLVGVSPYMDSCRAAIALCAAVDHPVLLSGEVGTGRELIARSIHRNSRRFSEPFACADCPGMSPADAENILFGSGGSKGLIGEAGSGVLFLRDVESLPVSVQPRLAQLLAQSAPFRILVSAADDLGEIAQFGKFHVPLLQFLQGGERVVTAPLRSRVEDIAPIASYHLNRLCEINGLPSRTLAPETIRIFTAYSWPHNVRQLVTVLAESIARLVDAPILMPHHLPSGLRPSARSSSATTIGQPPPSSPDMMSLQDYREACIQDIEKTYITSLLAKHGQSITEACRIAGLSRSRLYALMQKYGLER